MILNTAVTETQAVCAQDTRFEPVDADGGPKWRVTIRLPGQLELLMAKYRAPFMLARSRAASSLNPRRSERFFHAKA